MENLKDKVVSTLADKFSKKKDKHRLKRSKSLVEDVFDWYEEGGPNLVKSNMEEMLSENMSEFDEAIEALSEGGS